MYNATLNFAAPFDGVASVVLLGLKAAASATMKASSIPSSKQFAPSPPLLFIASISHKSSTGAEIGFPLHSNARHLFSE